MVALALMSRRIDVHHVSPVVDERPDFIIFQPPRLHRFLTRETAIRGRCALQQVVFCRSP